jgi:hypothetical protein
MDRPVRTDHAQSGERESVNLNLVSDGYFNAMGIGFVAGRDFNDRDTPSSPKVAIVNEAFVRRYLAGNAPVGEILRMGGSAVRPDDTFQIVGVVKDSKYRNVQEKFAPIAYIPASQLEQGTTVRYLLRTSGRAEGLTADVTRILAEVAPEAAVRFTVMQTQIEASLLRKRLMAALSALFGVLATLMAVVGLYGVFSYMVARRQNEIGIRMALGADRASVLRMILGEAGFLLIAGLTVGLLISLAAGRAATTLLPEMDTPVSVALYIVVVAALPVKPCVWKFRRGSKMWRGSDDTRENLISYELREFGQTRATLRCCSRAIRTPAEAEPEWPRLSRKQSKSKDETHATRSAGGPIALEERSQGQDSTLGAREENSR